jgi:hypothetical protein
MSAMGTKRPLRRLMESRRPDSFFPRRTAEKSRWKVNKVNPRKHWGFLTIGRLARRSTRLTGLTFLRHQPRLGLRLHPLAFRPFPLPASAPILPYRRAKPRLTANPSAPGMVAQRRSGAKELLHPKGRRKMEAACADSSWGSPKQESGDLPHGLRRRF